MPPSQPQPLNLSEDQVSQLVRTYMQAISSTASAPDVRQRSMAALSALARQYYQSGGPGRIAMERVLSQYGATLGAGGQIVSSSGKPLTDMPNAGSQLPPPGFGGGSPAVSSNPAAKPLPPIQPAAGSGGFSDRAGEGGYARGNPAAATGGTGYGPNNPRQGAGSGQLQGEPIYNPGGIAGGGGSGDADAGGSQLTFDEAMAQSGIDQAPEGAYFKNATGSTIGEITPGFTQSDAENNPAWQYFLQGTGTRDTYAEDSLKDDFMAAEMVQRLLGGGDVTARLNPADQLMGTQQLMGQMTTPGQFMNPQALMDAMFAKVAKIDDPELQMTYINGALSAMKPYMSSTDYMNLQSAVSRQAEDYMVQGINNPTQKKDFLGLLQGIR